MFKEFFLIGIALGVFGSGQAFAQSGSIGSLELSALTFSPTYTTQLRDSYGFSGGLYRISTKGLIRFRIGLEGSISSGTLSASSVDYVYSWLQLSAHLGFEIPILTGAYGSPFILVEGIGGRTLMTLDATLAGEDRFGIWSTGYRAGIGFQFGSKNRGFRIIGFFRGEPVRVSGRNLDIGGIGGSLALTY